MTRWRFRPHENLHLKLISLGLAIALWSIVPDPSVPHLVRGVPVQLVNIPPELALAEPFETELDVWVRGNPARTRELLPGELSPHVDMFGAFRGENVIAISPRDIPTPLGVSVDSIEPSQVRVVLDERVRRRLPINPVIEGSPAPGYQVVARQLDPAEAEVSGPRTLVREMEAVSTETVNISGRRTSLVRTVVILTGDPLVRVEGTTRARLRIEIAEVPVIVELQGVTIRVVNASRRVAINPERIGVVLRGPPSLFETIGPDNLIATLDVAGLRPRSEDYHVEPTIEFRPAELAERIEVLALTPQRRIDVHVFEQPPPAAR